MPRAGGAPWARLATGAAGNPSPGAGRPNWPLTAMLGLALGAVLVIGLRTGHGDLAGHVGLGMILVALPAVPDTWQPALRTLGARSGAVLVAAVAVDLVSGRPSVVGWMVIVAAGVGAFLPTVRATAALAVLLCGLRVHRSGALAVPGLGEAIGAIAVLVIALTVGLTAARRRRPRPTGPEAGPAAGLRQRWRADARHAVRMMVAVAVAAAVSALIGIGIFGGHWLITAVLLSIQRTGPATRLRLAQRLVGNTFGALLVALVVVLGPSPTVMAVVAAALFVLAFGLRSISYLWWAVTAPPVLLIVGDFPAGHAWYEGGIRVVLGLLGAVIVLAMFWQLPGKIYRRKRSS